MSTGHWKSDIRVNNIQPTLAGIRLKRLASWIVPATAEEIILRFLPAGAQ
jgi:hypothetical protein